MKIPGRTFILLLLTISFFGCRPGSKPGEPATAQIREVRIADYGQALFALDPSRVKEGLDSLSGKFHFFIGENADTLQVIQIRDFITDPFNRELEKKCRKVYPDLAFLEKGLTETFGNIMTVIPGFQPPEVYTYVSGLLYESPVQYLDSVLLIGMDMFLGWDSDQYRAAGIPVYMTRRAEKANIMPECSRQIAISFLPDEIEPASLLDYMMLYGKVLYAMDLFLPSTPDSLKTGYSKSQLEWCRDHEASVWKLFIDQELLFKKDAFINNRFIQDGPFTSGLPEGAPAMLGRWIGWQIVRSYMKKNDGTSLSELFSISDSQQILSESGYKPKK